VYLSGKEDPDFREELLELVGAQFPGLVEVEILGGNSVIYLEDPLECHHRIDPSRSQLELDLVPDHV
jgi:hypothetical protein